MRIVGKSNHDYTKGHLCYPVEFSVPLTASVNLAHLYVANYLLDL